MREHWGGRANFWLFWFFMDQALVAWLAAFKADPGNKGKVCNVGLWRYSRHPNYFFEWLHWFAYPLIAVGAPNWWVT